MQLEFTLRGSSAAVDSGSASSPMDPPVIQSNTPSADGRRIAAKVRMFVRTLQDILKRPLRYTALRWHRLCVSAAFQYIARLRRLHSERKQAVLEEQHRREDY